MSSHIDKEVAEAPEGLGKDKVGCRGLVRIGQGCEMKQNRKVELFLRRHTAWGVWAFFCGGGIEGFRQQTVANRFVLWKANLLTLWRIIEGTRVWKC